jgi:hypothetical protein
MRTFSQTTRSVAGAPPDASHPRRRTSVSAGAVGALLAVAALVLVACNGSDGNGAEKQDIGSDPSVAISASPPSSAATNDSFQIVSSPITVTKTRTKPVSASCGPGYYVRASPPPALQPTNGLGPAYTLGGDDKWVSVRSTAVNDRYGSSSFAPFMSFSLVLYNESLITNHTVTISWWCDAVTPWITKAYGGGAQQQGVDSQISPIDPSCFYCGFDITALTNVATGMVLNNKGAANVTGNPVIAWPNSPGAPNQNWNYQEGGSLNEQPVYSIWSGNNGVTPGLIVEDPNTHLVSYRTSSGSVPSGGSWYYQNLLPGPGRTAPA